MRKEVKKLPFVTIRESALRLLNISVVEEFKPEIHMASPSI